MAGFATEKLPVRCRLPHELIELFLVRIEVAGSAGERGPVIKRGRTGTRFGGGLVAIVAGDRQVTSRQRKTRCFVPGNAECGRLHSLQGVAALTAIEIRRGGELPPMFIAVAVRAVLELHLVQRVFDVALRNVALRAPQRSMLALQRIGRRGVLLQSELCRLEAFNAVAGFTRPSIQPLGELSPMRIGAMAIHALLKCQRLLEISSGVALHTLDFNMLAEKRVFGFGMIKVLT